MRKRAPSACPSVCKFSWAVKPWVSFKQTVLIYLSDGSNCVHVLGCSWSVKRSSHQSIWDALGSKPMPMPIPWDL